MRLQAYDNAINYKEITKRCHDKNQVRQDFYLGMHVLLYNLGLKLFPRKHKLKWLGLFIDKEVFSNGVVEIQDPGDAHNFKVNGKWTKNYVGGDIPTEKVSLVLFNP